MNNDLKIIKKKYGEKMMHLCRELFPDILEQPGLLSKIILNHFEPSKFLYDDLINNNEVINFKNYIYSFVDEEKDNSVDISKTPQELLDEAGYYLYECKTEKDIQFFKKYYASGEELCTFRGGRLNRCYVFFAVKKNVNEIKRKNFSKPERQDEYGTSVISIQFARGSVNTLSIKNRYNHRVNNPDATFSNNLDNIIPGLTNSFEKEYNFNLEFNKSYFEISGYVCARDGKYYKYNYEINNIYYCQNNIIIDNFNVIDTYRDQGKYIILDYFILDLENKKIKLYDNNLEDSFVDEFKNIDKINVLKSKEGNNKIIKILYNGEKNAIIELNNTNIIIKYRNDYIKEVIDNFLYYNEEISQLDLPNLTKVGDEFLSWNRKISQLNLPSLTEVGNEFLSYNCEISQLDLPNLRNTGNGFLWCNRILTELNLPNLTKIGNDFLLNNRSLISLYLPKLTEVGEAFLYFNKTLISLSLPNLVEFGNNFLNNNDNFEISISGLFKKKIDIIELNSFNEEKCFEEDMEYSTKNERLMYKAYALMLKKWLKTMNSCTKGKCKSLKRERKK